MRITRSWNPIVGCRHECVYCWARRLAEGRLSHLPQYRNGFTSVRIVEKAFNQSFKPGETVFTVDMGDMWGDWVPGEWIKRVLSHASKYPRTVFLFLTKNPKRYHEFLDWLPPNSILGATIETNRDTLTASISRAPPPSERYQYMKTLPWPRKLVSIEPILDFDPETMIEWIKDIQPETVHIGYDNYSNKLPEPPLHKTLRLIRELRRHTQVTLGTIRKAWNE